MMWRASQGRGRAEAGKAAEVDVADVAEEVDEEDEEESGDDDDEGYDDDGVSGISVCVCVCPCVCVYVHACVCMWRDRILRSTLDLLPLANETDTIKTNAINQPS